MGEIMECDSTSSSGKAEAGFFTARPKNGRVAMVQCPKWANVPPIAIAYIKGAVHGRDVQCFDLNHDLLKRCVPNYRQQSEYLDACSDIVPFMKRRPDFQAFEESCRSLSETYAEAFDDWVERLKDFGVVGFSLYQENLTMSTILARRLRREHGVVCLAGGPSVNMDDHVFARWLLHNGVFDVASLGIAEDVIDELLERIITGQDLGPLPGILLPGDGDAIRSTTPAKPVDLTRFSPPNYDDFELNDYFENYDDRIPIYAVAGCVGNCEFCTIHELHPGYRHKPIENIQQEMLELHRRYGKRRFFFSDGMFLGNREDAMAIFDFAIANQFELGIQIRLLPYWDDEELVCKASKCVHFLQAGLESASENVRRAMRKMISQERTLRIYQFFYQYKLPLYSNIIVGYPNESDEDFEDTYRFLEEYLKAPNHVIGTSTFFVPNGFPTERYNIRVDAANHWLSDYVDVYDRLNRVLRLRRLAESLGRHGSNVYFWPSVEGLPFDSLSGSPEELSKIRVGRYAETPKPAVGSFCSLAVSDRYVQASGWAKLPDRNEPGREVILCEPSGRIVARAFVNHLRPDVAKHFNCESLERSGWICVFKKDVLRCSPDKLRAYLYTASDGTAWRLRGASFASRVYRSIVAPRALSLLRVLCRGADAVPGGSAIAQRLRAIRQRVNSN